jgi:hypothetical protein
MGLSADQYEALMALPDDEFEGAVDVLHEHLGRSALARRRAETFRDHTIEDAAT